MGNDISLTPGFSPVKTGREFQNRFNGFPRAGKPLKRLTDRHASCTRLKPGVNEIVGLLIFAGLNQFVLIGEIRVCILSRSENA
jgi:hypothetical protein